MANEFKHTDKLGRNINLGDCVAVAHHNRLVLGRVEKINERMLSVCNLKKTGFWDKQDVYRKYPNDCILVDSPDLTAYLLKS